MSDARPNPVGINLSFAVKRWVEPEAWTALVSDMGLDLAQFSFDLIDPLWPQELRTTLARQHGRAAEANSIAIHSAFVGLACYTYNNLLHPLPEGREAARLWWRGAIETAAELGTVSIGGPLGGLSVRDSGDPRRRAERLEGMHSDLFELLEYARSLGLREWLVEPVPLKRETPHTIAEARALRLALADAALPVRYCVDIGHALYQPLYGAQASLEPWLELGDALGLLHLQQTDGQSDSHWGLDDPRGVVRLSALDTMLEMHGQCDLPVILELFHPFEASDEFVLRDVRSSVEQMLRPSTNTVNLS